MTPTERRVLAFIDTRLESMLRAPAVWGSDESVELQVLQLLELRLVVMAPLPALKQDRRVQDAYEAYLLRIFPGAPPETLTSLLAGSKRQAELSSLLDRFIKQQRLLLHAGGVMLRDRADVWSGKGFPARGSYEETACI